MNQQHGFFLTEVLIALFLTTSVLLALLMQQWQTSQQFNQALMRSFALNWLDNNSERLYAKQALTLIAKPFNTQQVNNGSLVVLEIAWPTLSKESPCCRIKRQLLVL